MITIQNYVCDAWQVGAAPRVSLLNPATEEVLAETSSAGVDFAATLSHAREVGGPALRALGFAGRAELLKNMSAALHEHRERLIDVAMANGGNTRGDAKFDIDGATGTLGYYASLGRKLGNGNALWDGESEQLTRSARFHGRHLWVPRQGVAVHINAFNFPAWGTFEKAAVALLAGMPVVSKPATATCLLAYEMVKILVEAEIMPRGSFQLIAGPARALLQELQAQDVLAFTGSADTGARLRAGPGPVERSVRVNIEADSLNSAVLGPDLEPGDGVYSRALANIVKEMTQKTGQKCTAIRRVFVATGLIDTLQADLSAELAEKCVGNPAEKGVDMGPLTSADQLRDYRTGVAELSRQARIVFGSAERVEVRGAPEGKGYFAGPVLLRADKPEAAPLVHSREVFGPVVTLMPYDGSAARAAELVALGGGSLACSVYSKKRAFLAEILPALAPYHGRVLAIDGKVAELATPHGTVLPQVVHGGPGRAGGGEELGGLRGLRFYMQRCGLQGNRALLEKLLEA